MISINFIKKWREFVSEAILYASDEFKNTLNDIQNQFDDDDKNNDIPGQLSDSIGEDIKNLIINCISINKDKNDIINFIPNNKLKNYYFYFDHNDNILEDKKIYNYYEIKKPTNSEIYHIHFLNPSDYRLVDELEVDDFIRKCLVKEKVFHPYEVGEVKSIYHFCTKDQIDFLVYDPDRSLKKDLNIKYQEVKIGRAVRQIFKELDIQTTDKAIEEFVNAYKSYIDYIKADKVIEIVSGEDIRHWYLETNNYGSGQLSNSCMRYKQCQPYFDIYTKNPDVCQLLILKSPDKTKICGRALLWKLNNGKLYMDRIYCNMDSDVNIFKKWGKDNNVLHSYLDDTNEKFFIQLNKNLKYKKYPFMDTFLYFDESNGVLSNSSLKSYIELQDTSGGTSGQFEASVCYLCSGSGKTDCDNCEGDGKVECNFCGGHGDHRNIGRKAKCKECKGEGVITCPDCEGSCKKDCDMCDGEGTY